jgi:hypothetical protein
MQLTTTSPGLLSEGRKILMHVTTTSPRLLSEGRKILMHVTTTSPGLWMQAIPHLDSKHNPDTTQKRIAQDPALGLKI